MDGVASRVQSAIQMRQVNSIVCIVHTLGLSVTLYSMYSSNDLLGLFL